jgi:hypothetical protein
MTKIITTIEKELIPLVEDAATFQILSDTDLKEATIILSKLNRYNDQITEEREKVTKPLNEALKAERARWKPLELQNTTAIEAIRLAMSTYQTKRINDQKQAQEAIAAKVASGKLKPETAVKKLDAIATVDKTLSTDEGSITFHAISTLKVTDLTAIPGIYFTLDEAKLLKDLKAGITVTGAEIVIIQSPHNAR